MTINITMPVTHELKPRISVVGVGGAGGNAVNNMIASHLEGVEFVVCNTDAQALNQALTESRIQLGSTITNGLGAGARPEVGQASAEEALEEIVDHLRGSHMVFITGGMGGGTGTGAAPVIARAVRDQGILTVGVVTKPFHFEGRHRMRIAETGLEKLQQHVDTLIVIPNQNLFRIANERTTFSDAFRMADQVLHMGVRGVTDLMVMPGLINLDFNDIRTVMSEMGKAMMGTGEAEGDGRAIEAAEAAISNPLLDDVSMRGARGVLINITGGTDMTLFEVDEAANRIRDEVDPNANIIFGSTFDDTLQGRVRVSVVATGIETAEDAVAPEQHAAHGGVNPSGEGHVQPVQPAATAAFRLQPRMPKPTQPLAMPNVSGQQQNGGTEAPAAPSVAARPATGGEARPLVVANATQAQAARAREPGFVPPPAVEPGFRRPGTSATGSRLPQPRAEGGTEQPETARVPSLFERVTAGFSLTRHGHERPEPNNATRATDGGQSDGTEARDEQVYDVPAFLRR